jgi:DNA-binding MarR family transcriptional regulator
LTLLSWCQYFQLVTFVAELAASFLDRRGMPDPQVDEALIDAAISASRAFNGVAIHTLSERFPDLVTIPILRTLWMLSLQGEVRMSELASRLSMTAPTAGRICGKLEEHGCLTRRIDPDDRRVVLVSLTEPGQAMFAAVVADMRSVFAGILSSIPPQRQADLTEALNLVFDGAQRLGVVWP